MATEEMRSRIDYLVLDPKNAQRWFCVLDDHSKVEYSLPRTTSEKIAPAVEAFLAGREVVSARYLQIESWGVEAGGESLGQRHGDGHGDDDADAVGSSKGGLDHQAGSTRKRSSKEVEGQNGLTPSQPATSNSPLNDDMPPPYRE